MKNDLTIKKLQECISNIDHKNNSNEKYYVVCLANINDINLQECIYLKEKMRNHTMK